MSAVCLVARSACDRLQAVLRGRTGRRRAPPNDSRSALMRCQPPGICAAWEDGRLLWLPSASSELVSVHVLQLKRTNVGIALVTSPRVLFLDEPTSGVANLHSYTLRPLENPHVVPCLC